MTPVRRLDFLPFVLFLPLVSFHFFISISVQVVQVRAGETENAKANAKFRSQVAPVLVARCLACHGGEATEGGYSLASFEAMQTAGDSTEIPIQFGNPEGSELLRRLTTDDESERMPADAQPLDAEQIAAVRTWIEFGGPLPKADQRRPLAELVSSSMLIKPPEHYPRPLAIRALALRADGSQVLVGGYGEVTVWNTSDGKLQARIPVAGPHIADLDLNKGDELLAVSSGTPGESGSVQLVKWQSPAMERVGVAVLDDVAADVAFSPDGSRVAIAGLDGVLRIAEVASEPRVRAFASHADSILAVAWSDDGRRLLTASRDRTAKLFDTDTWDLVVSYDRHERAVGGVAFIDQYPLTLDETGRLRLMDGSDNDRAIAEQGGLPRYLQRIAAGQTGVVVAAGNLLNLFEVEREKVDDGKDKEDKPKTKTVTRLVQHSPFLPMAGGWIASVCVRNSLVASGSGTGEVWVWNGEDHQMISRFTANP